MKTVFLISGGKCSVLAAYYVLKTGMAASEDSVFYFNDTLIEDIDLYRFLVESVYFLSSKTVPAQVYELLGRIPELAPGVLIEQRGEALGELFAVVCQDTRIVRQSGGDPWGVFREKKFIGNTRVDLCSRILKREPRKAFTDSLGDCEICLGFSWSEMDRYESALGYESNLISPLATDFVDTEELWGEFHEQSGVKLSRSYELGYVHDNCGGGCVKAGLAQWALLYKTRKNVYLWHEEQMEAVMAEIPSTKPFLRKTIDGEVNYISLKQYREQYLEKGYQNTSDWGGCGCAMQLGLDLGASPSPSISMIPEIAQALSASQFKQRFGVNAKPSTAWLMP